MTVKLRTHGRTKTLNGSDIVTIKRNKVQQDTTADKVRIGDWAYFNRPTPSTADKILGITTTGRISELIRG